VILAATILFWIAFVVGLIALAQDRWGIPLYVRYEMLLLWDLPRALDTPTDFR